MSKNPFHGYPTGMSSGLGRASPVNIATSLVTGAGVRASGGSGAQSKMHAGNSAKHRHFLRQRERDVLINMINSAIPLDTSGCPSDLMVGSSHVSMPATAEDAGVSTSTTVWRLLIFDDWGRDVIAPLLNVGDLRELGITLYMHIRTARDFVPGAPTIYFCAPTAENIEYIASDCEKQLYEWVYLNFTAQIPRLMLELLARRLASANLADINHVRIFDRTLSYVALDNDLFSLLLPRSFLTLNRRSARDEDIESHLNAVVTGLSHVLLSLHAMPLIAHSKTGVAEEVARRLTTCLTDSLKEGLLVPAPAAQFGRPLLLIVDRSSDFATALHHPFSYRGLLVDQAGMRLNKCHVHMEDDKEEVLELDPERDQFYAENGSLEFGAIGAKIEASLKQYKAEYASLAEESVVSGESDSDANAMSRLLASAPLLAERKRCLDAHTKLAYSFLRLIQQRALDRFHGVELGVLQRDKLDKEEFAKLLRDQCGTLDDRQRAYLVAYLMCTQQYGEDVFVQQQLSNLFDGDMDGADLTVRFPALAYLKHLRSWSINTQSPTAVGPAKPGTVNSSGAGEGFGWGFAQQLAKNIASTLGGNVVTELPLTRLVEALLQDPPSGGGSVAAGMSAYATGAGLASGLTSSMRGKLLDTVEGYDPHLQRRVNLCDLRFSQAIVFVIGGGNIAEYDDLKRWEALWPHKAVSYGCTAIISGLEMLQELSVLGSELQ